MGKGKKKPRENTILGNYSCIKARSLIFKNNPFLREELRTNSPFPPCRKRQQTLAAPGSNDSVPAKIKKQKIRVCFFLTNLHRVEPKQQEQWSLIDLGFG